MTKRMINLSSGGINIDGETLSAVKIKIESLIEKYGECARINFCRNWEYDISFEVETERLETDSEYAIRLRCEEDAESRAIANRLKLYEQLKKEFGDNNE